MVDRLRHNVPTRFTNSSVVLYMAPSVGVTTVYTHTPYQVSSYASCFVQSIHKYIITNGVMIQTTIQDWYNFILSPHKMMPFICNYTYTHTLALAICRVQLTHTKPTGWPCWVQPEQAPHVSIMQNALGLLPLVSVNLSTSTHAAGPHAKTCACVTIAKEDTCSASLHNALYFHKQTHPHTPNRLGQTGHGTYVCTDVSNLVSKG